MLDISCMLTNFDCSEEANMKGHSERLFQMQKCMQKLSYYHTTISCLTTALVKLNEG